MRNKLIRYTAAAALLFAVLLSAACPQAMAQSIGQSVQEITAGQSVSGALELPVEVDSYRLTLDRAGILETGFSAPETGEWKITLTDGENQIVSRSSKDAPARTGLAAGEYCITVAPVVYSSESYTLTAGFTAADDWEQELNDSAVNANSLEAGGTVKANLSSAQDTDCFEFTLTQPRYVSFEFAAQAPQGGVWALTVLDENNSEAAYAAFSAAGSTDETVLMPGSYTAEVAAVVYSGADYSLSLCLSDDTVVERIMGTSRIQTAISISRQGWEHSSTDAVVLANAYSYPDALAGVSLAYALDAPILLTGGKTIELDVLAEIDRLGADKVYILGGELAVSARVADALASHAVACERIYGTSRFDTAAAIAKKLQSIKGTPTEVFFACSDNYPDALAISGIAALKGCPVIYISPEGVLAESSAEFLRSSGVKKATVLGGNLAIASAAEGSIKKAGASNVSRIAGDSRFATCIEINKKYGDVLTGDAVCTATGMDYPDALAGGVFAAKQGAPLVLLPEKLTEMQTGYIAGRDPSCIYIFGGSLAVSDEAESQLR